MIQNLNPHHSIFGVERNIVCQYLQNRNVILNEKQTAHMILLTCPLEQKQRSLTSLQRILMVHYFYKYVLILPPEFSDIQFGKSEEEF